MAEAERARGASGAPDELAVLGVIDALLGDLGQRHHLPLSMDTDLVGALGVDSLTLVELHDRLERTFGVQLSEAALATASTPRAWLEAISSSIASGGRAKPHPHALGPTLISEDAGRPPEPNSVPDALWWHVAQHGERETIRILGSEGAEVLSYRSLAERSLGVAQQLRSVGLSQNERVALVLPTCSEYFTTFLGVVLAGGVPVPLYPPSPRADLEGQLRRMVEVLRRADAAVMVCDPRARSAARVIGLGLAGLRRIVTPGDLHMNSPQGDRPPEVDPDAEALVQFTSGSTGNPKGVSLTHAQLVANIAAMGEAAAVGPGDRFVSWLPLYHDMGLIGAWLAPLVLGIPLSVLSPLSFLARPARWLQAISSQGGTLSAGPNFAYAFCVDRIADDELEGVDLSHWRLAFNGSEPVTAEVIDRFSQRFSRYGFRAEAMCPAYGLAEVGVGAAFSPLGRGPKIDTVDRLRLERSGEALPTTSTAVARQVVSCGRALPGYRIRVIDESGSALPDRREGEVQCSGPSATRRYVGDDEATKALWRGGFLSTGDVGYLVGDELYLTGRKKDVIIRAGRKLHPEDLEAALSVALGLGPAMVCVFGTRDEARGTEQVVVAVESEPLGAPGQGNGEAELHRVVAKALAAASVTADHVVVVPPGALPKTANGKVQRGLARDRYERGTLRPAGRRPIAALTRILPFTRAAAFNRILPLARVAWTARRGIVTRVQTNAATLIVGLYGWVTVAAIGTPVLVALALPSSPSLRWRLARFGARTLCRLNVIRVDVDGSIPDLGPLIVVANHTSFLDGALFVLASPKRFEFVASSEIASLPIFGWLLRRLGCTFLPRGDPERSAASLAKLEAVVRGGARLLVFPEGSISMSGELHSFRLGAFFAAARAGCDVLCIGIQGANQVLPAGSYLVRPGSVRLVVGERITPSGRELVDVAELRDRVFHAVAAAARSGVP